jgi:hypothetical protein
MKLDDNTTFEMLWAFRNAPTLSAAQKILEAMISYSDARRPTPVKLCAKCKERAHGDVSCKFARKVRAVVDA